MTMSARNPSSNRRGVLIAAGAGVIAANFILKARAAGADTTDVSSLEGSVEVLRRALVDGDGAVLSKVVDEQLTYSHSDGRVWSKRDLLENIAGKKRYLSIDVSQQTVHVVGQTGVVRHTYDVVNNLADGKTSSSHVAVLLCWIKSGQDWRLLARSGTTLSA
jgi:hypothetical protein